LHFWDASAMPTQTAPPNAGVGLLQDLVFICSPPPHVAEHEDQVPKSDHPPLTGHGFVLHFWDASAIPTQAAPPNAGAGLLQDLVFI